MYFLSKVHRRRFTDAVRTASNKCSGNYLGAVYLLCADHSLRAATTNFIGRQTSDIPERLAQPLTADQYALFKAAQDIYTGSAHICLQDLSDNRVIQQQVFEAIVEALQIARNGRAYICRASVSQNLDAGEKEGVE